MWKNFTCEKCHKQSSRMRTITYNSLNDSVIEVESGRKYLNQDIKTIARYRENGAFQFWNARRAKRRLKLCMLPGTVFTICGDCVKKTLPKINSKGSYYSQVKKFFINLILS